MADSLCKSVIFLTANGKKVEVTSIQIAKVREILGEKFENHQDQNKFECGDNALSAMIKPSSLVDSSFKISGVSVFNAGTKQSIGCDKINTIDDDSNYGKKNEPIEYLDDSLDDDFFADVLAAIDDGNIPAAPQSRNLSKKRMDEPNDEDVLYRVVKKTKK